jgi:hypothetical protein
VLGLVIAVVFAAVVVFILLATPGSPSAQEWRSYPAVAGADTAVVLERPSLETTERAADALLADYRTELTESLGLEWTQVREPFSTAMPNGYEGQSLLQFFTSAAWEGSVTLDDPAARQAVLDAFTRVSTAHGLTGLAVRNDLLPGDPSAEREFGALERGQQALWSFTSWGGDALAGLTLSSEVIDRTIPTADDFDGDFGFTYAVAGETLYVTVEASAPMLLAEKDRAEFVDRLAPFEGRTPPSDPGAARR